VQQIDEGWICTELDLLAQACKQVRSPLPKLAIRGASPSGCKFSRSTLTGGCSSDGAALTNSGATPLLAATSVQ
jgi:hypothetical protein